MSSTAASKVSFTVRRPTPVSRTASSGGESDSSFKIPALPRHITSGSSAPGSPLARSGTSSPKRTYGDRDSSEEEDEELQDELVTGFDAFGVQRVRERKREPQGPLVIPALRNKDWRELARKRKSLYVPPSAQAETGADGSVGGLGTKDTINSGPQKQGLQMKKRVKLEDEEEAAALPVAEPAERVKQEKPDETEDQKALRAILASAQADDSMGLDGSAVDIIPPPSEDDAYRQDVEELPESATLQDYERVPVSQFGAALLRGMGWKEGTSASKKNKGLIEPWLPQARPALLGIGAKEKEALDDGSKAKKGKQDKRYVPVMKVEKRSSEGREVSGSGSGTSSSRHHSSSRESANARRSSPDRRRERDRRDDYGRDGDRRRDDRRDYTSGRERDRDRRRDRSVDRYDSDRRRRDGDRRGD